MIKSVLLLKLSILLLMNGCKEQEYPKESASTYFGRLDGSIISTIDSVIERPNESNYFVLLFNFHDCNTCVDAGLRYCLFIDSIAKQPITIPIATMTSPFSYQQRVGFHRYVYTDSKDIIRKEIKFAPTPILILLNKDNKVISSFLPSDTINMRQNALELYQKFKSK